MKKKLLKGNLSDQLSQIINTKPHFSDEDSDDDLIRKDDLNYVSNESSSDDDAGLAAFRKINLEMLDQSDKKYASAKTSRLEVSNQFNERTDDKDEIESNDDNERVSNIDNSEETGGDDHDDDSSENDNNTTKEKNDSSNEDEQDHVGDLKAKVIEEMEKGLSVKNQLSIYDSILTCRIQFQKCLSLSNRLPISDKFLMFKSVEEEAFQQKVDQSETSLKKLLNSLLKLQEELVSKNTTHHGNITIKKSKNDAFEEILHHRHEDMKPFRNDIIQKWNDKTRVSQMGRKNFSAFEQSTLQQIDNILVDKQRLINRTRTKRSNYRALGEPDDDEPTEKTARIGEIYDDDDFYHQILRELLERKTTDVTDPVQLGRQFINLQKARNKMKKTVDTKASKGRKIRYGVHQKLVNFMMPVDNTTWDMEAGKELFTSIFGSSSKTS